MREVLGQPVVIENVAGAGGNLGVGQLARAEPDGYTIGIGQWSTHVVNAVTYTLPYDVRGFRADRAAHHHAAADHRAQGFPRARHQGGWSPGCGPIPDKATAATVGAAGGAQVSSIYFRTKSAPSFALCRTAAAGRRCRTWRRAAST
jgi:hypothetical protein